MNPDQQALLCERVGAATQPLEIRVCCPRGHFLAAVSIAAPRFLEPLPGLPPLTGDDLLLVVAEGRYHQRRSAVTAWYEGIVGDGPVLIPRPNPDFALSFTEHGEVVVLSCRRCPGWTPQPRNYQRIAAELATHALAGHREYRLAS